MVVRSEVIQRIAKLLASAEVRRISRARRRAVTRLNVTMLPLGGETAATQGASQSGDDSRAPERATSFR